MAIDYLLFTDNKSDGLRLRNFSMILLSLFELQHGEHWLGTPTCLGVARGSEVKAHHPSGFYDEDEDLRRKIRELTGIYTVSAKTARDGY